VTTHVVPTPRGALILLSQNEKKPVQTNTLSSKMTDLSSAYQRKTHREHILSLPDTYVGSIETANEEVFVHEADRMRSRCVLRW